MAEKRVDASSTTTTGARVERASRGVGPAGGSSAGGSGSSRNNVVVKVGMVGDAQVGKTSLMVKYVEGKFDEDYIHTLGVNFMEKTIALRNTEITFSIWDLGGHREFISMLPLVCNDAVAILFMFDLSRKATLTSVKEWYRQVRSINKVPIYVLLRLYLVCPLLTLLTLSFLLFLLIECVSVPSRDEVRPLCQFCHGRTGGNYETGTC